MSRIMIMLVMVYITQLVFYEPFVQKHTPKNHFYHVANTMLSSYIRVFTTSVMCLTATWPCFHSTVIAAAGSIRQTAV